MGLSVADDDDDSPIPSPQSTSCTTHGTAPSANVWTTTNHQLRRLPDDDNEAVVFRRGPGQDSACPGQDMESVVMESVVSRRGPGQDSVCPGQDMESVVMESVVSRRVPGQDEVVSEPLELRVPRDHQHQTAVSVRPSSTLRLDTQVNDNLHVFTGNARNNRSTI